MPKVNDLTKMLDGIGLRVAELRISRGLTQEQLAERIGLSTRYMQRIEAGRQNFTLATLARLGDLLGVQARELLRKPRPRVRKPGRPWPRRRAG